MCDKDSMREITAKRDILYLAPPRSEEHRTRGRVHELGHILIILVDLGEQGGK